MTIRFASRLPASALFLGVLAHAAVIVDAGKVAPPPQPLPFAAGGQSPDGHTLAINSRYFLLDGKPWFPVMGEFQYSRYPAADWEPELLKMKAGGIRIVSTYVFWIHHEEIEGQFDWSGRRDLRHFVELAARHGLYVWVRVGPWDHGEVRNGGLPDWVLRKTRTRQNDPAYLKYVERFYGEISRQLKGLFWKDGGSIIGVQIENEYHERGPGMGEDHILTLKRLAREAGLDAPFYSVTGWDDATVPPREVIPVFGGYPDGFWYRSLAPLPPSPNYFFTPIRCDENVDDNLCSKRPDIDAKFASFPFFTAEMGGGMELAYHRRPWMSADDIAALDIVKLGAGVTLYGYYMFHGGTNPDGKLTTLQESQATGYPQDVPIKTYDFQAPLGEFGQMHPSFRDLKSIHLFLQDFGSYLAPMTAFFPAKTPSGKLDRQTPRVAVRAGASGGFVFLNNYQKDHPLPEQKDFQVQVKLSTGAVSVPRRPVRIPSGAYTFWPIDLPVGGAVLEYATAQPLCKLDDPDTMVFFAWPGIDPEFAFQAGGDLEIEAPEARVKRENGRVYVSGLAPGLGTAIRIHTAGGRDTAIVLLSRDQARNLWKAPLAGRDRLVYSPADLYFEAGKIHLASTDPAALTFGVYPGLEIQPRSPLPDGRGSDSLPTRGSDSLPTRGSESLPTRASESRPSGASDSPPTRTSESLPSGASDSPPTRASDSRQSRAREQAELDRDLPGFRHLHKDGIFQRYGATVKPVALEPVVRQLAEAGRAAPVKLGDEVALAPPEAAFEAAARWSIRLPDAQAAAVGQVFLRITYQGDVARLYAGDHLITDDFYHGAPWEIGLHSIPAADLRQGLEVRILPLRADAPIYLAAGARPAISEGGQVAKLTAVQLVPEYRAVAELRP